MTSSPSPAEVQFWLEWAGGKLLGTQVFGVWPQSYRSFWPDYPDEQHTAYGYTQEKLKLPSPGSNEIPLMDEILSLVLLTPVTVQRRIISARILVHPLNGRNLYSWVRIAETIHSERRAVKEQYRKGLGIIVGNVQDIVVIKVRAFFSSSPPHAS